MAFGAPWPRAHFFFSTKTNCPCSAVADSNSCPVWREKAWKSLTEPGSVASTRSTCPEAISLSDFLVRSIGNGQFSPRASSSRSKSIRRPSAWSRQWQTFPQPSDYAALQIIRLCEALLIEPCAGLCRAGARLAVHDRHRFGIELGVASRQLVERNVACAGDYAAGDFCVGSDIEQDNVAGSLQCLEPLRVHLIHECG